jgi:hypothetical protein
MWCILERGVKSRNRKIRGGVKQGLHVMTGVIPVFRVPHAIYSSYRWEDCSELRLWRGTIYEPYIQTRIFRAAICSSYGIKI